LNRVLAECRHAHPHRRIISNIAVRHPVHCDPDRIAQLVSNLLEAALAQAAPCGPVSIAAVLEDGGLSIDVWNAGEPIPAERVNQLFAPALHAHTASRPIDALSLHACRLIVDAHQGLISVISNKAHGTQCSVWIPIPAAGITSLTAFRRRISETSITHISPG
jgi:K+-sensing histidine kinase KdpD